MNENGRREAEIAKLFRNHSVIGKIQPRPAKLLRNLWAEHTGRGAAVPEAARRHARFFPVPDMRRDLIGQGTPDGLAKLRVGFVIKAAAIAFESHG